jgi:hypothetical protein
MQASGIGETLTELKIGERWRAAARRRSWACLVGALSDEPKKKACLGGRKSIKYFS